MPLSPLETKEDLVLFFEKAEKKSAEFRIGTEHEVFLFDAATHRRATPDQISALLEEWSRLEGGTPLWEQDTIVGLKKEGGSLSLEPGGQFELSGAPLKTLSESALEIRHHHQRISTLAKKHHLFSVPIGADPVSHLEERSWIKKARYDIMRPYMATKGSLGHEMMTGTCTVQVNLDYSSEEDMVKKMRVGVALQPLVTALFAHSPLSKGKPNGYQSWRHAIWQQTDPDRCGMPFFVFETGMGYERYIEYALQVPMYFIRRQGRYLNVAGIPFQTFLEGNLDILPGEKPTLEDWNDHLTTIFTEVRLKNIIEMRGADSGPLPNLMALPSFWVGLLYDPQTFDEIYALTQSWALQDIKKLFHKVAREGLQASFQGRKVAEVAKEVLEMSYQGLGARNLQEEIYLTPLFDMLASGKSFADQALETFQKSPTLTSFFQSLPSV